MPLSRADFETTAWLRSPHLQTLWPTLFRKLPKMAFRRERLELPDGDFLDLDWSTPRVLSKLHPLVVMLHGLEGSSESPYVRGLAARLAHVGIQCVVMNFRGCSGEPNRLARAYHSGDTADLEYVVEQLQRQDPERRISACGFSLGGNVLLKYLGESGSRVTVSSAVAVSVPFVLSQCADRLNRGFSRFYQWLLVRSMRDKLVRKFRTMRCPINLDAVTQWRTFRAFDHHVTAPLHGFESGEDYYRKCSSRQFLGTIQIPTLIVQANDDPFMTPQALPTEEELSASTILELSEHGGHVGFVSSKNDYWLDQRIVEFFTTACG